ncbi:MAG TPA: phosphate ABC transporter permease PstA [Treponemataceae bacterium]|nr:phosphate ABC transporter permease PstA [Treponemataceae bacterium]
MKRKIRAGERVSVGFVWLSAAFTIATLFLILGYILWNGFFYSNNVEYSVTSDATRELDGTLVIVNPRNPIRELPFDALRGLYSDEFSSWKKPAGFDADSYPYVDDATSARLAGLLGLEAQGELVEFPGDAAAAAESVAGNDGGIAIVDAKAFGALDPALTERVRVVPTRSVALGVNPSVVEIRDNRRIGTVHETAIGDLYAGKISNWKELDGSDLPVTVLVPPPGSALRSLADRAGFDHDRANGHANQSGSLKFIEPATMDEYYLSLAGTSGAVGLVEASRANGIDIAPVKLSRRETGRNLTLSFLLEAPKDSGKIGGISTIILNTFAMILLTLIFSIPPGLFAAIYLVEYAREGRLVRLIRLGTETLAGIPSIIFGLFGMLVFVQGLGWGISLLSGSLTVTLMILPTIVRTAEEALKAVPGSLQEGSLALGATKVQTVFRVVLPAAFPAIASGVILAIGRALGETAALIYTMGSNYNLTGGLFDSTRTLAVHVYLIIAEGISSDRAFASGAVLVFFILAINGTARFVINRMGRMARG